MEEIRKMEKIKHLNFEVQFHYSKLKYQKPIDSLQACIIKNKTYSINLYVPVTIKYKDEKKIMLE